MLSTVVSAAIAIALLLPAGDAASAVDQGFVLRVGEAVAPDSLDPAISASIGAWTIEYATCMKLVNLPDREGSAGERPIPEAADRITISPDGRRYTFHIRAGLRFSDGRPLTASDFAYTLQRLLDPTMNSIVWQAHALDDVVGVDARRKGAADRVAGIVARGNTLTIRLTHRAPDLLARLVMPPGCPVPNGFPIDPAGVDDPPAPGSGPYTIAQYRPGREVVLTRNPYYRGLRPHAPAEIDVTLGGSLDDLTNAVERGDLDYVLEGPPLSRLADLSRRYGVNRGRLYLRVRPQTIYLAFNTDRALFHDNANLRRAIGFALDRPAVIQAQGSALIGTATDRLVPPALLGSEDDHLYPLRGASLPEARRLGRGHLRSGHAILYISSAPTALARGAAVQRALARIGIQVEVHPWGTDVFFARLQLRNEPYDMAIVSFGESWPDAAAFLSPLLLARSIPEGVIDPLKVNFSRFRDPTFDRQFDQAAQMSGNARQAAFARLEAAVLSGAAPVAPLYHPNDALLVSDRVGCVTYNPTFTIDYAAFCLR